MSTSQPTTLDPLTWHERKTFDKLLCKGYTTMSTTTGSIVVKQPPFPPTADSLFYKYHPTVSKEDVLKARDCPGPQDELFREYVRWTSVEYPKTVEMQTHTRLMEKYMSQRKALLRAREKLETFRRLASYLERTPLKLNATGVAILSAALPCTLVSRLVRTSIASQPSAKKHKQINTRPSRPIVKWSRDITIVCGSSEDKLNKELVNLLVVTQHQTHHRPTIVAWICKKTNMLYPRSLTDEKAVAMVEFIQALGTTAFPIEVFGKRGRCSGKCVFCGKALWDKDSPERGYDSVCADVFQQRLNAWYTATHKHTF